MGSKPFILRIEASSPQEAFEMLRENALKMFGENPFSGTIATCKCGKSKGKFEKFSTVNDNLAIDIVRANDGGELGVAHYIDLGQVKWRVKTLLRTVQRYTATYRQKFAIVDKDGNILEPQDKYLFPTKGAADKKAIELMMSGAYENLYVQKTYVKLDGTDVMSTYEWDTQYRGIRQYPKRGVTQYSIVDPINRYLFFGKGKT